MKKFYTLAAAATMALSMNAQLYLVGTGTVDGVALAWDPATPQVVTASADGYVFDIASEAGVKMSTAFGDWTTFNASALYGSLSEATIGTPVALTNSDQDIMFPWQGDWHCVVAADLSTITVTTTTAKPTDPVDVWIKGEMNGWEAFDEWKFQTEDGVSYSIHCSIPAGVPFKISDAAWSNINYGVAGGIALDSQGVWEGTWYYQGENTLLLADFTGTISFTLPAAADGLQVKLVSDEVPEPAGFTDVYIRGAMNDWATADEWKFQTEDGVTYAIDCSIAAGVEFKIADPSWVVVNHSCATPLEVESSWSGYWSYNIVENSSFATDFTGTISVTLPAGDEGLLVTLTRTNISAIEDVSVDGQRPTVYYNLQGMRVDRPTAPGIYIANGKKVLVK